MQLFKVGCLLLGSYLILLCFDQLLLKVLLLPPCNLSGLLGSLILGRLGSPEKNSR